MKWIRLTHPSSRQSTHCRSLLPSLFLAFFLRAQDGASKAGPARVTAGVTMADKSPTRNATAREKLEKAKAAHELQTKRGAKPSQRLQASAKAQGSNDMYAGLDVPMDIYGRTRLGTTGNPGSRAGYDKRNKSTVFGYDEDCSDSEAPPHAVAAQGPRSSSAWRSGRHPVGSSENAINCRSELNRIDPPRRSRRPPSASVPYASRPRSQNSFPWG